MREDGTTLGDFHLIGLVFCFCISTNQSFLYAMYMLDQLPFNTSENPVDGHTKGTQLAINLALDDLNTAK